MGGAGRRAVFAVACAWIVSLRGEPRVVPLDVRDERGERAPALANVTGNELNRRAGELALAQRRALVAGAPSGASITWSNLGPTDGFGATPNGIDSGRIRAIVTDPRNPSTLYVATAGGGVFKTTNADAESAADWQWTPLTDDIQSSSAAGNLAVGDLAMSPADSDTLWLAMGDPVGNAPSRGFFITHDGGATWQQGGDTGATTVSKILPLDGSTLLVGTDLGLWRSTDGGRSFAQIPVGGRLAIKPGVEARVSALARLPNGRILMGHTDNLVYPGTFIWTSDDGGLTWARAAMNRQARNPSRFTIATSRASSGIAWSIENDNADLAPALLRTVDGGTTWNEAPIVISTFQGNYNQLLIADDEDPQRLFIGTNILYRTADGGVTLERLSNVHADQHTATWWTSGGKKRLLVGNDGGLALFKDPVHDLSADRLHNKGIGSFLVYKIGCGPDRTAIGTQDNGTLYSTARPGGFTVLLGGDGFYTLVHPVHQDWMLAQLGAWLGRTTDGLEILEAPRIADPTSLGPIVRDEGDSLGDSVYRAGMHTVYRSADFGASFTTLGTQGLPQTGTILQLAVAPSSRQTIGVIALAEGAAQLLISRDGGSTWTRTHDFHAPNGTNSLTFDPNDASSLYVTAQSPPFLQRSRDGGRTWEALDRNGYPAVWSHAMRVDWANGAMLYAATDFGVYWSQDAGASWSRYGQGLPWVSAQDLCIVPGRRAMRVGTFGRGAWEAPLPPPTPLSISLSNAAVVLSPGSQEKVVVSVSHAADLAVTGLPAGVVATLDPRSVAGAGTATLTLAAQAAAAAAQPTQFAVTASAGPEQATSRGSVSVVVPASDFGLSLAPAAIELESGASRVLAIRTSATSGVAQSLQLSMEGLPGDTSARFDRTSIDAGDATTLTVTAGQTAVEGDATIVAQSTAVTHRVTLHVRVSAPRVVSLPTTVAPPGGCGSPGVDPLAVAGLALLLRRRRRRR